jgi:carbonic anhydrase
LSEVISVRGFNYPNDVNLVINRDKATSIPKDFEREFEVKFANGTTGNFYPIQLHFHSPSEHTINGRLFDLELHIVHVDSTGTAAAVLGIIFEISNHTMAQNFDLDQILPRSSNNSEVAELNLGNFLNNIDFRDFYNYNGSFTSPPCTEGINWFVLKEVQTISKAQYDAFTKLW